MNFQQKIEKIIKKNKSLLCIGLDSAINSLPKFLLKEKYPQFIFNKTLIESTFDLVCAYKPNSAFYEERGEQGLKELQMTCDFLQKNYPAIPIILDAKRGDIGNTSQAYVNYCFDYLKADAVTLSPYLGKDSLDPFLNQKDKGLIVLTKTSNPGSSDFQDLIIKGKPLYEIIAETIVKKWNKNKNCLLVVGATYPKELARIRKIAGDMYFLVPGIGTQNADLKLVLQAGKNSHGRGLIINSSRSIIFASPDKDFAAKARAEANKLRELINKEL